MGLRRSIELKPGPPPECRRWFENKEFTSDWLTTKLPSWFETLAPLRDRATEVLDVGSYEGRSAIAFLELCPRAIVTTVDLFGDPAIEARFDRNLAQYGRRVVKLKARAAAVLDRLNADKRRFDIIYLDAGKGRSEAFAHSVLAWPLLREGGVMIWDDVVWKPHLPEVDRPGPGIELFAQIFADCYEKLHLESQLIVRKTGEWPPPRNIAASS